jgi:nucleoside-diphosphate-sugar epimerase
MLMNELREKKRSVWILGGTGFVGSPLVDRLLADPSNRLNMLVHHYVPYRKLEQANLFRGSLVNFDLNWFRLYPPDVVFHLARLGGRKPLGRYLAARRGGMANRRMIGYLAAMEKPPVIVYVSGSLMYGNQMEGTGVLESAPMVPLAFARQYIRAEEPWTREAAEAGLSVKMVRPGWIIGPGSWFRTYYWNHYLLTGRVPVYGDGSQLMSVIHVDDLACMINKVPGMEPGVLNLFAGSPVTQAEFSGTLASLLGAKRESISLADVGRKYGKSAAEALGSSIPLGTLYPDLWKGQAFRYPDLDSMLRHTIGHLKSEQRVLAKTPEWSPVEPSVCLP